MATRAPTILLAILLSMTPALAQHDSLSLTDGSRLEGTITAIHRDGVRLLEPDGTELDHAWEEVASLNGASPITIEFGAGNKLNGVARGLEDSAWLSFAAEVVGDVQVPVAQLAAAAAPPAGARPGLADLDDLDVEAEAKGPLEPKEWTGRIALSASLTAGNSDVFTAVLDARAERDWSREHLELRALLTYGTSDGEVNRDSQLVSGLLRHYYQEDFYSYASLEAGRDEIQDLDLRVLANVGAGWNVWKESDKETLDLEAGVGYRFQAFSGGPTRNDATLRAAVLYKDVYFEKLEFTEALEMIFPVTDPGAWLARSESTWTMPLSEAWAFRAGLRLEYLADPAAGRKKLDVLATLGLEYSF